MHEHVHVDAGLVQRERERRMGLASQMKCIHSQRFLQGFQLKGDMLKSLLGQLRLRLPRLSSQEVFNRVCPADGGSRYIHPLTMYTILL